MLTAGLYLRRQCRRRPPRPRVELKEENVQRVLLISSTGVGDTLFSTPVFRALKECQPGWRLDLVADQRFVGLVAHNPHLRQVWTYSGRNRGFLTLIKQLRQQQYDMAIILHGNDPEATLLAYASGSPYLIGSSKSPLSFAYAAGVEPNHPLEHAVEQRLNFVRLLGIDTPDKRMELFLPPDELDRAREILSRHFGAVPPVLLALHPTGSSPYKWWPTESFRELGNYLYATYGAPLLIISGKQDRQVAEDLAAGLRGPTLVTGGNFPILTVGALLSQCQLLVGNDSGPMHMALALGIPCIDLLGPDHPARIGPYQVDWGTYLYKKEEICSSEHCLATRRCIDNRCIQAIKVEEVIRVVQEWWEPRSILTAPSS
jgi:ADP-heptose:LPS heptosyltransferase